MKSRRKAVRKSTSPLDVVGCLGGQGYMMVVLCPTQVPNDIYNSVVCGIDMDVCLDCGNKHVCRVHGAQKHLCPQITLNTKTPS